MMNMHAKLGLAVRVALLMAHAGSVHAAELQAGAARVEISDRTAGPVHDPCFAKALVLRSGNISAVLLTIDAVAIGEIGRIPNSFLPEVRTRLRQELNIPPEHVLVNASHCHGIVRVDSAQLAVAAVKQAWERLTPVKVGVGVGSEARISENRRLWMKDGSQVDMRRAYSLPPDEAVARVGPIDPQIGLLRLDRLNGTPLAVVYSFACHPIMNPPSAGSSADFPGYASRVLEDALGGDAVALFVQGCGGDINPVRYKESNRPPDAEPLGNLLGLSSVQAWRRIETQPDATLQVASETISVPRAADSQARIAALEAERTRLLNALRPTNIDFKAFVPLLIAQKLSPEFPSHHAQSYLHDAAQGLDRLQRLDAENRAGVEAYVQNIRTMEQLTRLTTNLALLQKHQARNLAAGTRTLDAEVGCLRVGDFKLVTFPGELTVEVGLGIKKAAADPHAFVAGYTNGYLYYTPTAEQRGNTGYAQEDCDSLVAPEWQRIFELKALDMLRRMRP